MIKDLTKGEPLKVILLFALPMLVSMFFQQLYNLADSFIAGNIGGVKALASISASTPVTQLFLAVAIGSTLGCSVIISKLYGAKKYEETKTSIYTAIISLILLAIFCVLIGSLITEPILKALDTPKDIFLNAKNYLNIYIFGFFFLFLYNIANSIFVGLGDSKTPLILLIISSLTNIALDYIFSINSSNTVTAVAWATFITQGFASIIAILVLLKRIKEIKTNNSIKIKIFDKKILKQMLIIAIPSIIQQSFISIGQLLVQGVINSYGSETISGYATALRINSLAIMCIFTLSSSMSSFTAQNIGINNYERIKKGYKAMLITGFILIFIIVCLVLVFSKDIINLFLQEKTNENKYRVIEVGSMFLKIVAPGYFLVAFKVITDGVLRGAGKMKSFMFLTFLDLFVRVVFTYIFNSSLKFKAVCLSFPIGWLITVVFSVVCYRLWSKQYKN